MSKKKTHEEFLKDLWDKNEHYRNGEFKVKGKYERSYSKILVEDKFGECMIAPSELLVKGSKPTIRSAINKTQYWKNMCLERFGEEGNDDLSQVEYTSSRTKVKIIDEFGEYWIAPNSYYQNKRSKTSGHVKTASKRRSNQEEVFYKIRKLHPDLEILPDQVYVNMNRNILVRDKYGVCKATPANLTLNNSVSISSAIDKTSYFINQSKEKHGCKYDYSLVEYKNNRTKVKIISKHGVFKQTPNSHLSGSGCPEEKKEILAAWQRKNGVGWNYKSWIKAGNRSKYFDSFKVYFIECTCEQTGEHFYKIGKTFTKVFGNAGQARFPENPTKGFPYKAKLLHTIEYEDGRKVCDLEQEYQKLNKEHQYIPNKKFNGMHECFSKIEYEKIIKTR